VSNIQKIVDFAKQDQGVRAGRWFTLDEVGRFGWPADSNTHTFSGNRTSRFSNVTAQLRCVLHTLAELNYVEIHPASDGHQFRLLPESFQFFEERICSKDTQTKATPQ
jgi:hypothetical protein